MTEKPDLPIDPHARITGNVSYWLLPAEEFYYSLQENIDSLAGRFGTTAFEPHVTVFSGPFAKGTRCDEILKHVVEGIEPITLRVGDVQFSEAFTKSLYIELASSSSLRELSERLRMQAGLSSDFRLMPHISLAYLHTHHEVLAQVASSIRTGYEAIRFNRVKAVATQASVTSDADVRNWFVIACEQLG